MLHNAQTAIPMRIMLQEMKYLQQTTHIVTSDATAKGVIDGTAKQCKSKAIDWRHCWMHDKIEEKQLNRIQDNGSNNYVDYHSIPTTFQLGIVEKQRPKILKQNSKIYKID